jgi:hypothetical protein
MSALTIIYKDITPGAMESATASMTDLQDFCNLDDLALDGITVPQVATLEDGYWKLGTNFKLFPDTPAGHPWGVWSKSISGADGTFTAPPTLVLLFSSYIESVGVTLAFDPYGPGWSNNLTITWMKDSVVQATDTFTPDAYNYSCIKLVKAFDELRIQFNSMSAAYRYLKLQSVILGIIRTFTRNDYFSLSMYQAASPVSETIEANTMEVRLKNKSNTAFCSSTSSNL